MLTFRGLVEPIIERLNTVIDWTKLMEELPEMAGHSLLLEITGEKNRWGLYVDLEQNKLMTCRPEDVLSPTAYFVMNQNVAWQLIAERKSRKQLFGIFMAYMGMGAVQLLTYDNKVMYHARLLASLWEFLQAEAFEGVI